MSIKWALSVVLITFWPGSAQAAPDEWRLLVADSWLAVRLEPKPSGLFSGFGHTHLVRATEFGGTLRYDPADPSTCALVLTIPVAQLRADRPEDRRQAGLKEGPDEGDRQTIEAHMRAADQLDAGRYGEIRFVSSKCRPDGVVEGTLEIRGRKKAVIVPIKIEVSKDRARARGEFSLGHSDFGFEPYSAALGTIGNGESLKFSVDLVAERVASRGTTRP